MFHMPGIDHSNFKAVLLQDFVERDPVNACGF